MTDTEVHRLCATLGIPASYASDRRLDIQPEAGESDLVVVSAKPDGTPVRLVRPAAQAWAKLKSAAAAEAGHELVAVSGFRSVERQARIIREHLDRGRSLADILRAVAAPGFSEHHTGRALDIVSAEHPALEESFERTGEFLWLERRAAAFGFRLSYPRDNPHGIVYEPWHWCWRP